MDTIQATIIPNFCDYAKWETAIQGITGMNLSNIAQNFPFVAKSAAVVPMAVSHVFNLPKSDLRISRLLNLTIFIKFASIDDQAEYTAVCSLPSITFLRYSIIPCNSYELENELRNLKKDDRYREIVKAIIIAIESSEIRHLKDWRSIC